MKGGLFGTLFDGKFDPVNPTLRKAAWDAKHYISIANFSGKILSGVMFSRAVPFIEKLNRAAGLPGTIKAPHIWANIDDNNLLVTTEKTNEDFFS